jgi:hypothetical protein
MKSLDDTTVLPLARWLATDLRLVRSFRRSCCLALGLRKQFAINRPTVLSAVAAKSFLRRLSREKPVILFSDHFQEAG